MSVTVVTGRAGSGKSRYLLSHITKLLKDPFAKVIVIVPGPLTFETEKNILQSCGVEGILGLEVLSIQRLCYRIFEQTGQTVFMTHAEKAVACRRALNELDHPFGTAVTDLDTFMADLMTRLKSHCQTPQSLREAAEQLNDAALQKKLRDTADVYEKYNAICGSRPDSADMYTLAAEQAEKAGFLKDAHVVIDGLDSATPAVMRLLEKVVAISCDTIAAFRDAGSGLDSEIFASERRDCQQFVEAAARSGKRIEIIDDLGIPERHVCDSLEFLEANLYRYPYSSYQNEPDGIVVTEAQTLEQEVKTVASMILREIRRGKRFRDIAVIGGGLDAYLPVIKSTFAQCGIPVFFDERRTLADNTFFDFLYKAMCAASGDMTAVTGYLYSIYAPISEPQQTALFAYAQRYAYQGWHYYKKFWRGDDGTEAEAIRHQVMRPLMRLTDELAQNSNAQASVDAVKRFLEDCHSSDKLETLCASIDATDTRGEAAYFRQVFEKSIEVLDGIARVFGNSPIDAKMLCDMVKTGFEVTKIAVIPPTTDEVGVYDLSVARLPGIDVLFAIGVHDGVWPARDDGPGILSSSERDTLKGNGIDIGVYDLSAEKLKIYGALTKPKERLILSYNTQTGQPSMLIDRLRRLFPSLFVQKVNMQVTSLQGMEADVLGALADVLRGQSSDENLLGVCARYMAEPGWREKAQAMLLRTNAAVPMDSPTAEALYGGIKCSATRIENYYKCPFKHFLDHGIKAKIQRDYVYDRIDIGMFMHLALDIFVKTLIESKTDIKTLSEEQTVRRMQAAAAQAAQQHDNAKLLDDERLAMQAALLTRELADTALRIRSHFLGSSAFLYASEQNFSFNVPTTFGDIVITGKIDRIDATDGYFRVVDYKSSTTKFSLNELAQGTSIQLPVYIEAARQMLADTGLKPAGGYYMRIGEKYHESADDADKDARMSGLSLYDVQTLSAFSAVLPGGGFAAIDQAVTSSGMLHSRGASRLFTEAELDALLNYSRGLIRDAAEQIFKGDTAIRPANSDVCGYCNYGGVCQINTEYDGNKLRETAGFDRTCLTQEGNV